MHKNRILLCGVSLAFSLLSATTSLAADSGKWMVRARALGVFPVEDSTVGTVGGKAEIDNNVVPEIDVTYFFTPNVAVELIAATTKHNVTVKGSSLGTVDAGSAWLLPPTLTLQYHFTQFSGVKPYVGAGVNYTYFYNEDAGDLDNVKYSNSFGPALQVGLDIPIKDQWYFNVDVKKLWIHSDVSFNDGSVRSKVDIDPWLVGVGIGYRF